MSIRSIELNPISTSVTLAKYLNQDYFKPLKCTINEKELAQYLRMLLEANQYKQYFSGQAPGNE
jgi:hypothetical protein